MVCCGSGGSANLVPTHANPNIGSNGVELHMMCKPVGALIEWDKDRDRTIDKRE